MKSILIMGAPGTGKGTLAQMLKENFNVCYIAMGDIFRENIKNKTLDGIKALNYIQKGSLVPDDITDEMIRLRLQKDDAKSSTILLDGYPRNLHQASSIIKLLANIDRKIDLIIWLYTPEAIIIDRICNRRVCRNCYQVYNLKTSPPKIEGKCDKCNGEVYKREDDNETFVTNRLTEYKQFTSPLINFYKNKVKLLKLDTYEKTLKEAYEQIEKVI